MRSAAIAVLLVLAPVAPVCAQPEARAQILVLGVYHFENPGLDVVKHEVADVLSPAKQEEIGRILDALERFNPTKIAVERVPERGLEVDSLYRAFRSGLRQAGAGELEQIGFRLAARLDHAGVFAIDHKFEFPFGEVMAYAQEHDTAFVAFVSRELARIGEDANRLQREHTVGEILRDANDPSKLAAGHGMYLRFARIGAYDTYVGATLVSRWYERNIRIFANLQAITEPGDRILILFGAGHAPTLRELVSFEPTMELIDPLAFLPVR